MHARRLRVLSVATFLVALESLAASGILARIADEFETGVGSAGQVTTLFTLAAAISGVPLSRATAHFPKRTLLALAMATQAVINVAILVTPSLSGILVLRALSGAAASLIPPNAVAAAASLAGASGRATALAWTTAGVVVAFLAGIPAATALGEVFGWRAAFALCAVVAGIGGAAVWFILPNTDVVAAARPASRSIPRDSRGAMPLVITLFGFAAAFSAITFSGPLIAASTTAVQPIGFVQALLGLGALGGLPVAVRLTGALGPRTAIVPVAAISVALMVQGLGLALAGAPLGQALQMVSLVVLGAGLFGLSPPIQLSLVTASAGNPEILLALNAAAVFLGQATGAALGGVGVALAGLPGATIAGLGCALVAAIFATGLPRSFAGPGQS